MSEEEKDILVSKRKYWTKIMKYNLVGTIFLVILFFLLAITIGDSCDGKVSEVGMGCNLILIVLLLFYLFLFISWPLSFIIYGYQSFKIYNLNTKELLEQEEAEEEHIEFLKFKKNIETKKKQAMKREEALDYDSAIRIWEELGEIKEAARIRKLKTEEGSVKVDQTIVQGDQITKTEIKDSVVSKSNIGTGEDDKISKLEKIAEMKKEGLIDDDEFKQMKKEILGK